MDLEMIGNLFYICLIAASFMFTLVAGEWIFDFMYSKSTRFRRLYDRYEASFPDEQEELE